MSKREVRFEDITPGHRLTSAQWMEYWQWVLDKYLVPVPPSVTEDTTVTVAYEDIYPNAIPLVHQCAEALAEHCKYGTKEVVLDGTLSGGNLIWRAEEPTTKQCKLCGHAPDISNRSSATEAQAMSNFNFTQTELVKIIDRISALERKLAARDEVIKGYERDLGIKDE